MHSAGRAPAFLATSLPTSRCRCRVAVAVSRRTPMARISHPVVHIRPRLPVIILVSTLEEEHFIHRHAMHSAKQRAEEKLEERFDFVPQSTADANSDLSVPNSDRLPDLQRPLSTPSKELPVSTEKVAKTIADSKGKKTKVDILIPPGFRRLATRARTDAVKFIMETPPGTPLRMPTSHETVTAAWELTLIFAVLMLLRAGVASTLRWVHNRLNATRGLKSNIAYEASVFECMQRPLEFLSLFTVGTALAEALSRPLAATGLLRHIMTLRELGLIFSATWFLVRWIDRIRSRFAVDKRIDKAQVDATSRIATVATFIVSLLISLDTIGINVQTVLAFGGIGGVAIGFAGREIISNFFGGFMIYITRPFSVGEWIRSIEEEELNGTVEDIGWYLTRVRTWDKRPLYIPNSRFSTLIVENGSRMDNRRILHTLHLRHEDMPVVPALVAEMETLLMTHEELDPRQHRLVYVDSFDAFSVKIWLSCYTKSVFLYDFRRVQQDVLLRCHGIIRARGAKLATIHTRDVRPGADTDRYGPFGSKATFGEPMPGVTAQRQVTPPATTDVPGSPRYDNSDSHQTLHTIESGIDLSRLTNPSTPSGFPSVEQPGPPVSVPSGTKKEAEIQKSLELSNAAVAATAAAFLAARRNAMRIEGNEKLANSQAPAVAADPSTEAEPSPVTIASTGAPSGEMKISAAPPRVGQGSTPSLNGIAAATANGSNGPNAGSDGRSNDENMGPSGGPLVTRTSVEDSVSAAKGIVTNVNQPNNSGEMKITGGRSKLAKPVTVNADGKFPPTGGPTETGVSQNVPLDIQLGDSTNSASSTPSAAVMKITSGEIRKSSIDANTLSQEHSSEEYASENEASNISANASNTETDEKEATQASAAAPKFGPGVMKIISGQEALVSSSYSKIVSRKFNTSANTDAEKRSVEEAEREIPGEDKATTTSTSTAQTDAEKRSVEEAEREIPGEDKATATSTSTAQTNNVPLVPPGTMKISKAPAKNLNVVPDGDSGGIGPIADMEASGGSISSSAPSDEIQS